MKVVLLSAPYGEGPQLVMPLGMMNIAAYTSAQLGDRVEIEVQDFSGRDPEELNLLDEIDWTDVEIVGFSVYSSHLATVEQWAGWFRAQHPGIWLVAGGPHPTLAWEHFTETQAHLFDAIVVSEGETPFTRIVERRLNGQPLHEPQIPSVARLKDGVPHLAPLSATIDPEGWPNPLNAKVIAVGGGPLAYTDAVTGEDRAAVALTTSRSCPMRCFFCSIIAMPDKFRSATPEQVASWLVEQREKEFFEHAYLMDADFFTTRQRVMGFAEAMHAALPDLTWSTSATVGHLLRLEQDLPRLYECGLRLVEMGIEAGSNEQLEFLGKKNFGKWATWQQSVQAVRALQRNNIAIGVDYIMFYPHQRLANLAENLIFIRRAALLDEESDNHWWNDLVLYQGTPLREFYESLRGEPFSPAELPDTTELYIDADVLAVRDLFLEDYRRNWHGEVTRLRAELKTAAERATDRAEAARLRLHGTWLLHTPYRVLEALIRRPDAPSALDACPWLPAVLDEARAAVDPRLPVLVA